MAAISRYGKCRRLFLPVRFPTCVGLRDRLSDCRKAMGKLPASSLVEVLVTSIIFLTVFTLSLETVTRLVLPGEDTPLSEAVASQRIDLLRQELSEAGYAEGSSIHLFGADTLQVRIRPYPANENLLQVTIFSPTGSRGKATELTYLVAKTER